MSGKTQNTIKRQWTIITYLLKAEGYVSTTDIQAHLANEGITSEIRNIQRDLVALQDTVPLECRKDDKPYSWRWKRLPKVKQHSLTQEQAIVFRLIETELKDHIPADLLERLEPILMKSRMLLATESYNTTKPKIKPHQGIGNSGFHGIANTPSVLNTLKSLLDKVELPKLTAEKQGIEKIDKTALKELKNHLELLKLTSFIDEIDVFIKNK